MNSFYHVMQRLQVASGFEYTVSLDKEHYIYGAHFPGNPVTPGVCIIQLCKELTELHTGEKLWLKEIRNVKFLSVINPREHEMVKVSFQPLVPWENGYKVLAEVHAETTRFARLSLLLQRRSGVCVVIPTYNNDAHLANVVEEVLHYTPDVIVVNDGSNDRTRQVLEAYQSRITCLSFPHNKGKGYALAKGFDRAEALGYTCAVTMDSDGQHRASDLPRFLEALDQHPGALIVGTRQLQQKNMPRGNTFANQFSNFWFALQTGIRLPDTQSGFRLYPLGEMKGMRPFTSRYEAELELLVRSAWRNIRLVAIPIEVCYPPPDQRVTHFRPVMDFFRISLLNTALVVLALFYGYPSRLIRSIAKSP